MALKIKTPPVVEPITLAEAKSYLRITNSNDDAFITALISGVRRRCEEYTQRSLITQTWTLWRDRLLERNCRNAEQGGDLPVNYDPRLDEALDLPRPPLQSVSFMNSYAVDNSASQFSTSNYFVDTASEPGRICLNTGAIWPVQGRRFNCYEIEFVAGYGSTGTSVPDDLKQGMFFLLKTLYADKSKMYESDEPRSLTGVNDKSLPEIIKGLWNPYRVIHL
jgi:uncharacterized phiE125 gp8 family phage protein